ncbi:unnamed protein product [Phytomonas sp. Hart1]|nr:unnamed protein product [Phytomonas sp. Hart1]|eukprot:CCW67536.1 unnamed protein product [Phytomonas sp. isolate Hart1]
MSLYGGRETPDDTFASDASGLSSNYMNESNCQRFWQRLMTCVRESQELDVLYDCRSRLLDMRECVVRHKQSTWVLRESLVTVKHKKKLRKWIREYDEKIGHPPLLEAVSTVRKLLQEEGGVDVLNPTVFKDPDMFIPKKVLSPVKQ